MRVAWVVKAWATGGAERMLLDLLPFFSGEVEVVALAALAKPDDLVPVLTAAGVEPRGLGSLAWPLQLRRIVQRERIDVVHFHGPYVGAFGRPALYCVPVGVVHTEHSVWSSHRRPTRLVNALSFGRNDAVVAVSGAVAGEIAGSRARGRSRVRVIRNGIDVDVVRADADRPLTAPIHDALRYVCVGHLRHRKGVDVLLDASVLLAREFPEANGVVVGEGEDAVQLREHRDRVGATHVELVGNRPDARAITGAADVFVIPSRTEGTPLALLDAMALERPIVATAVGGLPELLRHEENALLVAPDDPSALAGAIARLLRDRPLAGRLGAAARATVERDARAQVTAAAYLDVYRSVTR